MMPGRPRLPTSIHEARGTARRDRENPEAPTAPVVQVGARPPAWLKGARRRRTWSDLVELLGADGSKVLTAMDAAALGILVDAFGDYLEATDLVTGTACGRCGLPLTSKVPCPAVDAEDAADAGAGHSPGRRYYTTRTKEGSLMIRPHPAVAVRQEARKTVIAILSRFGMMPADRAKVIGSGGGREGDGDPMRELLGDVG